MTVIFFRTLTVYALLMGTLRLMGKRQIGELEVSELVTTLLVSEIASLPIENPDLPLAFAAVPIVTLLFIEVLSSALLLKFPALRGLFSSRPTVLIRGGVPNERELRRARITLEELLSALRQKEVADLSEVDYAILEQNGQISVLRKKRFQPPDAESLGVSVKETGIAHLLVSDGRIDRRMLRTLPNADALLDRALRREGCTASELLFLTVDDKGRLRSARRDAKSTKGDTP